MYAHSVQIIVMKEILIWQSFLHLSNEAAQGR